MKIREYILMSKKADLMDMIMVTFGESGDCIKVLPLLYLLE